MVSKRIEEARNLQNALIGQLDSSAYRGRRDYIAGADISFNLKQPIAYAAIAVLRLDTLEVVEESTAVEEVCFPYIPGYLSFREVPPLLSAWKKVRTPVDVVMLDGHGIIHPRSMGIACHFGIEAGVASMGCAKKPFVGEYREPGPEKGCYEPVYFQGEVRGYTWRSKNRVKPVYISPGTGMSLEDCLLFARLTSARYRLPEPTRQAHLLANRLRRSWANE